MRQACIAHVDGRFLAANAACAKADHGFVLQLGQVGLHRRWKFCELGDAPVDGVLKRACIHLKLVACVQRHHRAALVVVTLV